MTSRTRPIGRRWQRDDRGEALPAAILFLGVMITILIGVHVVIASIARTAVQAAADAALAAAQAAGPDPQQQPPQPCAIDPDIRGTARQCDGILAARIAMAGARNSIRETRPPAIAVEHERGVVTAVVFGGTISPVLGTLELTGQACGPLDDVPASELASDDLWRC